MEIALIALSIISLSFMISYVSVLKKLRSVSDGFASLFITYTGMKDLLENKQGFEMSKTDQEIHNENFIKFLSDSRDWAFDYIENSQNIIKEVAKELETMGREDLSNKLVKLLPENNNDGR